MTPYRTLALAGAAIALAAGAAGFLIARSLAPPPEQHAAGEHEGEHESEHGEDDHDDGAAGFIPLNAEQALAAGVNLARVERGSGPDLLLPGRVSVATSASSVIGAPLDGTIVALNVAPGSIVARGSPIATISSPEAAAVRARLDVARIAAENAEAASARGKRLFDGDVLPRQEWETLQTATERARADLREAEANFVALGSPTAGGIATVRSPIKGVVTEVSVASGSALVDGPVIARVSDVTQVELVFDAPPESLGLVAIGARLEARWTGGQSIEAVVTAIAPGRAGAGATVRATPSGATPSPGTVISARLVGGDGNQLTVPSDAVQTVDGAPSVFVMETGGFRARHVVPGRMANGRTEIVSGLQGDEQIAGIGAFLLKAELAKGNVEHEH